MANQWLRLWHDMPNDPKWRTIAKLSKQPIAMVMAVYLHLLVSASISEERGEVTITKEDIASALDTNISIVSDILQGMQDRVLKGNKLMGWEKRQPLKEDNSAVRAKVWRESKKQSAKQTNAIERSDKEQEQDKDKETLSVSSDKQPLDVFAMYETWQPDEIFPHHLQKMGLHDLNEHVPEIILKEFVCFWMTKPAIKKTQEGWHHALAQSYQYAVYREKNYAKSRKTISKSIRSIVDTATDTSWWSAR